MTYQPDLSQSEQDALADWAVTADFVVVAPARRRASTMSLAPM